MHNETGVINHSITNFENIFSTSSNPRILTDLEGIIPVVITDRENIKLTTPPTNDEIRQCFFVMPGVKAQGPDGMPAIFFKKKNWEIVGKTFTEAISHFFLLTGKSPKTKDLYLHHTCIRSERRKQFQGI